MVRRVARRALEFLGILRNSLDFGNDYKIAKPLPRIPQELSGLFVQSLVVSLVPLPGAGTRRSPGAWSPQSRRGEVTESPRKSYATFLGNPRAKRTSVLPARVFDIAAGDSGGRFQEA